MKREILFLFYISLIYIGSTFYVLAAYYHLALRENWYFWKAYMMAIPLVLVEYLFTLNGNHYMHHVLEYSPVDVLIITICFYFVNLWLLNYYVLKHRGHNIYMEMVCFGLVLTAFLLTTVIR